MIAFCRVEKWHAGLTIVLQKKSYVFSPVERGGNCTRRLWLPMWINGGEEEVNLDMRKQFPLIIAERGGVIDQALVLSQPLLCYDVHAGPSHPFSQKDKKMHLVQHNGIDGLCNLNTLLGVLINTSIYITQAELVSVFPPTASPHTHIHTGTCLKELSGCQVSRIQH